MTGLVILGTFLCQILALPREWSQLGAVLCDELQGYFFFHFFMLGVCVVPHMKSEDGPIRSFSPSTLWASGTELGGGRFDSTSAYS